MKLIINKNQIDGSPDNFLKRAGYAYHLDRKSGKESYARRLGSGFFPKLHMYVYERGEEIEFNLHLDQKQASYEGQNMHSGEYDGPVVEGEINYLKSLIMPTTINSTASNLVNNQTKNTTIKNSLPSMRIKEMGDLVGHGQLPDVIPTAPKKSFWQKIFP